jgi:curved DNA-binding protein CbpA
LRKVRHVFALPKKNHRQYERLFIRGIAAESFESNRGKTDRRSFGMETLYELLGARANDDAESLRAAFRRAVKQAHPDVNPGDPDAGLKFRRIMRANEILGDVERRAAYDQLLEVTRIEQERAAKHAITVKIHKLASGVMALAGTSAVAVGGYGLFLQLSANTLTSATTTADAVREPAAIVAARPVGEGLASASAPAPQTAGYADITTSRIMPTAESMPNTAEIARGRIGPQLDRTPKHTPKFLSAYIDHSTILYRLRTFARSFAELAPAKRLQRGSRPTASSSHLSQINTR